MNPNQSGGWRPWKVLGRITARALLLGVLAAVVGGLFAAACGAVQCLAERLAWDCAGTCGLRGAVAGLAAGAIMGAVSGIYHVEEPAAAPVPAPPRKRPAWQGAFLPVRWLGVFHRGGVRPKH